MGLFKTISARRNNYSSSPVELHGSEFTLSTYRLTCSNISTHRNEQTSSTTIPNTRILLHLLGRTIFIEHSTQLLIRTNKIDSSLVTELDGEYTDVRVCVGIWLGTMSTDVRYNVGDVICVTDRFVKLRKNTERVEIVHSVIQILRFRGLSIRQTQY